MYHATRLVFFVKTILLSTSLLAVSVVFAESVQFNASCGSCHGNENIGTNVEGVIIPPVRDGSRTGIENSLNAVAAHNPDPKVILEILPPVDREDVLSKVVAELAALTSPTCTPPQTLVNGVCTDPAPTPTPQPAPTPSAPIVCDDSANTPVCINQQSQLGNLGSTDSSASKSDVYKVTCPKPAVAVSVAIAGLTAENPAKLSVQASKGGAVSRVSTDLVSGDGVTSKAARLAKGSGVYKVKITKSKSSVPGIVQYDAAVSCLDKKKARVVANIVIKKSQ